MLPADVEGEATERTPAQNQTVRNVFVIGPDKKVKLLLVYPMTTGRNFDEVLRVIDSLQLTANHEVATPAQWQPGEDVIIAGSVSNDAGQGEVPGRLGGAQALHPHRPAALLGALRARPGWRRARAASRLGDRFADLLGALTGAAERNRSAAPWTASAPGSAWRR